jgi:hypothetical protein
MYDLKEKFTDLSQELITQLSKSFDMTLKPAKKIVKKTMVKSQVMNQKKSQVDSKVNLILNKLSDANMEALTIEFVENINQLTNDEYEVVMKTFYIKMLNEISFVKIYLKFLKIIMKLYSKVFSYSSQYFIDMVETKIKLDYTDYDLDITSKYNFIKELEGETIRTNNLVILKGLVTENILSQELLNTVSSIILNQSIFLADIYNWFNLYRALNNNEREIVKKHLQKVNIASRDKILLENLLSNKVEEVKPEVKVVLNNTTDKFKLEIMNILEEYELMENYEDVEEFVKTRCLDMISKNKFGDCLVSKYFTSSNEKYLDCFMKLVKSQILYKTSIAKGINNNLNENVSKELLKNILQSCKKVDIMKGLENLYSKY